MKVMLISKKLRAKNEIAEVDAEIQICITK